MTSLKGVSNTNRPNVIENIRDNIITFLDWGLINAGGYFNVSAPSSGHYGGDAHVLRPVRDPRFTDGQVWEAYRSNFVWESGMGVGTPVSISGVFVDDAFSPRNSGHYIDYVNGRVVFDTAQTVSSTVKLYYSYKWVKVIDARFLPIFRRVQTDSFRVDNSNFLSGSGIYSYLSDSLLQLPLIAVEIPTNTKQEPYELGNSAQYLSADAVLHVIAEDDSTASRIGNILINQEEKTVFMFDTYLIGTNDRFPLDYRGEKSSNPLTYPDLVALSGNGGFRYTSDVQQGRLRISDTSMSNGSWISHRIYHKPVKWTTEAIILLNS